MTLLRDGTILRLFPGSLHENGSCEEPPSLDMPIDVTQTVEGLSTTITFTFNAVEGEEIQEPHPSNPGYTMLCAEDNAVNQRYFYRFFSMFGQDVAMTENGEEAFELYKSKPERFPCIFMDLMMPVIRQIRAFESSRSGCHRRALIVGLSTHPVPLADISTLSEVGFDLVMRKPIDDRELYQMFLGSPRTNIVLLYGDLTEEEKSAYPRSLGPLVECGNDARSNAIKHELRRREKAGCVHDVRGIRATSFTTVVVKVVKLDEKDANGPGT